MAKLTGSNVSWLEGWLYENIVSHWTSLRFHKYRNRLVRRKLAHLGAKTGISFEVRILSTEKIRIGSRSSVNNRCVLDGRSGLTIGDNTLV